MTTIKIPLNSLNGKQLQDLAEVFGRIANQNQAQMFADFAEICVCMSEVQAKLHAKDNESQIREDITANDAERMKDLGLVTLDVSKYLNSITHH